MEKIYCMSLANQCEDKHLCCYYCKKFSKCTLTKCHDDGSTCNRACDKKTLDAIQPKNHMDIGELSNKKIKERVDEL